MGTFIVRTMRSFAAWVVGRQYRLVLLTVLSAYTLALVAAGLLVLQALRRGTSAAVASGLIAILAVTAIGIASGANVGVTLSVTVPVLAGGVGCAALLAWARSLNLGFQAAVIVPIALVLLIFVVVPGAGEIGEIVHAELLVLAERVGFAGEELAALAAADPDQFVAGFLISLELSLLLGLMLGLWWFSLLEPGVRFGREFRALKLGRSVGIALMVLVVAGQVLDARAIQLVAPMAVMGFLFQGLAVMHSRSHSDNWPRMIVVVAYLGLLSMTPLMLWVLMGLSAVGLLDNFFELRRRVAADG